jgi:hypothetical protein
VTRWRDLETAEELALRQANEERIVLLRARMGSKWLLHPDNRVKKHPRHALLDKKAAETPLLRREDQGPSAP